MLTWLGRFLSSSIGKKVVMALTGLGLVGFLIGHLVGNLTLFADDTGEAFNGYAHALESNPALPIIEVGLLVLFIVHIVMALRVSKENRAARTQGYSVRNSMGNKTLGSSSMLITGLIIGVFLVIHIIDFRVPNWTGDIDDLALAVKQRLATPLGAGIYMIGVIAVGIHVSHAFKSAFQSLGLNHPRYTPLIERAGLALAILLFIGFASFPILLFMSGGGTSS
jgi:succinate dehydrogenase / fumarate reductase cytochrome b subunit